jgi:putative FmdB family regulatory protein
MALYEFFCEPCKLRFEQITRRGDPDEGKCPKCREKNTRKLISRFAVGGQGDLRESTMHGCHGDFTGIGSGGGGCGHGCGHDHSGGSSSHGGDSDASGGE